MVRGVIFNLCLMVWLLSSAPARGGDTPRTMGSTKLFERSEPGATGLALCPIGDGALLWTYSRIKKQVIAISPKDGADAGAMNLSIPKDSQVTSLTCQDRDLWVLLQPTRIPSTFKSKILVLGTEPGGTSRELAAPANGLSGDLKCLGNDCWISLDGKVWHKSGDRKWANVSVPSTSDVPHLQLSTEDNPFADWQEKLAVAQGRITRVLPLADGQLALLDSARTSVLLSNKDQKPAGDSSRWIRWGRWGPWEGDLISPKAIAPIGPDRFAVSDTALKAILIFDRRGGYLGALGEGSGDPSPLWNAGYPIQLVTSGTQSVRVFVLDLLGEKIIGRAIEAARIPTFTSGGVRAGFNRINLFRRSGLPHDRSSTRCLSCHDGTFRDDSTKILSSFNNHPSQAGETSISCDHCHDPHHGGGKIVAQRQPPFLRFSPQMLCSTCHPTHANLGLNHREKGAVQCSTCHQAHGGQEKLLKQDGVTLCASCHLGRQVRHRPVGDLSETSRGRGIVNRDGELTCITCHSAHLRETSEKLLKPTAPLLEFCASCHGAQAKQVYGRIHGTKRLAPTKTETQGDQP